MTGLNPPSAAANFTLGDTSDSSVPVFVCYYGLVGRRNLPELEHLHVCIIVIVLNTFLHSKHYIILLLLAFNDAIIEVSIITSSVCV